MTENASSNSTPAIPKQRWQRWKKNYSGFFSSISIDSSRSCDQVAAEAAAAVDVAASFVSTCALTPTMTEKTSQQYQSSQRPLRQTSHCTQQVFKPRRLLQALPAASVRARVEKKKEKEQPGKPTPRPNHSIQCRQQRGQSLKMRSPLRPRLPRHHQCPCRRSLLLHDEAEGRQQQLSLSGCESVLVLLRVCKRVTSSRWLTASAKAMESSSTPLLPLYCHCSSSCLPFVLENREGPPLVVSNEGQRCKQVPNVDEVVKHCYSLLA